MPSSSTLLLFSIGPVQEFIAAARTTRDLWSGSYLLSTLIASALKDIKGDVIFPCVDEQPLLTGLKDISSSDTEEERKKFLTPTLPNRFLAVLPSEIDAAGEAERLVGIIQKELDAITSKVKECLLDKIQNLPSDQKLTTNNKASITFDAERFDKQVGKLLEVQWQTLPVEEDIVKLREIAKFLPQKTANFTPLKGLDEDETWGTLNSIISWLLDGAKSNRSFNAWRVGRWKAGEKFNKDCLTGKEEALFTVHADLTADEVETLSSSLDLNRSALKSGELLGAASVIKRFWDSYYLTTIEGLPKKADHLRKALPMPNTHSIACYDNQNEEHAEPTIEQEKYFAIIAFDGDQMGQWISGNKLKQPITKQDHLDFSRILNDFSVNHALGIIEDSEGKLIYSGGDDVLAMVPAGNALSCATDLRDTFCELFVKKDPDKYQNINASAGIAIGHYKSPLQDIVKAAQAAEKRAKRNVAEGGLGRGAVAITLFKRSGEILEWGSQWKSRGKELLTTLTDRLKGEQLSKRFPHKLEALLIPYLPQSESVDTNPDFEKSFADIIELEINHCLKRSGGGKLDGDSISLFSGYWSELHPLDATFAYKLTLFINLLRTSAWLTRSEKTDEKNPA